MATIVFTDEKEMVKTPGKCAPFSIAYLIKENGEKKRVFVEMEKENYTHFFTYEDTHITTFNIDGKAYELWKKARTDQFFLFLVQGKWRKYLNHHVLYIPPNQDYWFEYVYVQRLILHSGEVIEEVAWLSKTGKSYIVDYPNEKGVRGGKIQELGMGYKRRIPVSEVKQAIKLRKDHYILRKW